MGLAVICLGKLLIHLEHFLVWHLSLSASSIVDYFYTWIRSRNGMLLRALRVPGFSQQNCHCSLNELMEDPVVYADHRFRKEDGKDFLRCGF